MNSFAGFLKFILLLLTLLAGFVFALQNAAPIGLWLIHDFAPRPVSVWLLLAFSAGSLSGLLLGFGLWRRIRLGRQLRQLQSELQQCRQELADLRRQGDGDQAKLLP
jgi:uncharacterized integral membrane protein